MPTKLASPITVQTPEGPKTATHKAYGFTDQNEWNSEIIAYRVLGYIENTKFIPIPQLDQQINITGSELKKLLAPNSQGKKEGIFRKDDVIKIIDTHIKTTTATKAPEDETRGKRRSKKAKAS